jgi:hypothetical protein
MTRSSLTIFGSLFFTAVACSDVTESADSGDSDLGTASDDADDDDDQADADAQVAVDEVDPDSLVAFVRDLSGIDTRYYTTSGNDEARAYIRDKLESYGYAVEIQDFDVSGQTAQNIVATKMGRGGPQSYILVDAHYDSTSESLQNRAPGASDNASGSAIVLEMARIFADIGSDETVKFVFFDAEEAGLRGSEYYANWAYENGDDITFVLNLDMVGGQTGMSKQRIVCEEDQDKMSGNNDPDNTAASQALNVELVAAMKRYTDLPIVVDYAYASDYEAFEHLGYVIVGLYEESGQESPHYHRTTDLLENMNESYFVEVARGAVGFVAEQCGLR